MDVKEAVAKAKNYLSVVFADEGVSELRLEEVEYDRHDRAWLITLGLMRPAINGKGQIAAIMNPPVLKRAYKLVRIPDDDGELPSIKIRELGEQ